MKTESYQNIKEFVERPIKNREMVITKRGKYIVPRKYHLTEEELSKIKKDKQLTNEIGGDVFVNPYVKMGCYHASIESLRILGPNQWHSFVNVRDKMQEIMSSSKNNKGITSWEVFEGRSSEGIEDIDTSGKIIYNMVVLQRLTGNHPYGEKLRQMKACIDIKEEEGIFYYRLNTQFESYDDVKPFNNTLKRKSKKI